MPERVLVTGGSGFIGLHLVAALRARGDKVTIIDDHSRLHRDRAVETLGDDVELLVHDLREPLPGGIPSADAFDAVYHLAAIVGVGRTARAPEAVLETNVLATRNLLRWCEDGPPGRLFLSSTSEVADGAAAVGLAPFPVTEDVPAVIRDPTLPRAAYAVSKLVGEMLVTYWGRRHDVPIRIGRYHNVYGPRMGFDHVIPQITERVLAGQDPLEVMSPHQRRAFCYVEDAVAATCALTALPDVEPLVVNIGNDECEVSIEQLARELLERGGRPDAEIVPLPTPAGSPDRRLPALHRLRALTGFEPRVSLAEGLDRTFAWYDVELRTRR